MGKMQNIIVKGARQHNLKNINLDIPKNKLVVFTGVSGSGKSSLAHDTIYAEGQRRYVESLSTYARQFLGIMEKPDVDLIEGLSPSISIDQKTTSKNPRSTVGTITEIYDYMRLLFSKIGHPHCPVCGREIKSQTIDQITNSIFDLIRDTLKSKQIIKFMVLSPVVVDRKGEFQTLFENLRSKGITQIRIDGFIKNLNEKLVLIKTNKHTIDAVIDKLSLSKTDLRNEIFINNLKGRISQSVDASLKLSDGLVNICEIIDKSFVLPEKPTNLIDHLFSEKFSCPIDNIQLPEIQPRTFSFNSPHGACNRCAGIGKILKVNSDLIYSEELSILEGGILPFKNMFEHDTWYSRLILQVCKEIEIDPKLPIKKFSQKNKKIILFGTGNKTYKVEGTNRFGEHTYIYEEFTGVINELEKRHKNTESDWVRMEIEKYMNKITCTDCKGTRLKKQALGITIDDKSIADVVNYQINKLNTWLVDISKIDILSEKEKSIAYIILKEIKTRLNFLSSVGLEYLTLGRPASSLSSGETQRIRLASQIGSGLTGVLYVLDEPTVGLHQKDNSKLIKTLKNLRDLGNTIIVVEHDLEMISNADFIIDFGPKAGKYGGEVIAKGTPKQIMKNTKSITGKYLSGKYKVENKIITQENVDQKEITLSGIKQNNLKNINVTFPLNKLITITGVSGSGKSSLLIDTLYPALKKQFNPYSKINQGSYDSISGWENINRVILIDQSPIGRTPRSNPATYTKLFDVIREVFAQTRDAKALGFNKSRFSFNLKGGRCDNCEGQGQIKIEMQFMSDLWVTCDACNAKRYNTQTLEVEYKGKNISEVLNLTVDEAREFFHNHPNIASKLDTLVSVGLGYIELGQPAPTLSGGEAQRVKLSSELSKKDTSK